MLHYSVNLLYKAEKFFTSAYNDCNKFLSSDGGMGMTVDRYITKESWRYRGYYLIIWLAISLILFKYYMLTPRVYCWEKYSYIGSIILLLLIYVYVFRLRNIRKYLANSIQKIACPECDSYIPLTQWKCECEEWNVDQSIFEGCKECRTCYGKGGMDIRGQKCHRCAHELEFSKNYDFKNWSVLEENQDSNKEFAKVKSGYSFRDLSRLLFGLTLLFLVIAVIQAFTGFYVVDMLVYSLHYEPTLFPDMLPIIFLIAGVLSYCIYFILSRGIRLIRNPKYKNGDISSHRLRRPIIFALTGIIFLGIVLCSYLFRYKGSPYTGARIDHSVAHFLSFFPEMYDFSILLTIYGAFYILYRLSFNNRRFIK